MVETPKHTEAEAANWSPAECSCEALCRLTAAVALLKEAEGLLREDRLAALNLQVKCLRWDLQTAVQKALAEHSDLGDCDCPAPGEEGWKRSGYALVAPQD